MPYPLRSGSSSEPHPSRPMSNTGDHEEEDLSGGSVLIPLPRPRTAPEEPCTMRGRLMLPWATVSEAEGSVLVLTDACSQT
jgi:hypothetical protein